MKTWTYIFCVVFQSFYDTTLTNADMYSSIPFGERAFTVLASTPNKSIRPLNPKEGWYVFLTTLHDHKRSCFFRVGVAKTSKIVPNKRHTHTKKKERI